MYPISALAIFLHALLSTAILLINLTSMGILAIASILTLSLLGSVLMLSMTVMNLDYDILFKIALHLCDK